MNAEQVVAKILSQARGEAEKILAAASETAQKENQRLEKERSEYRRQTAELAAAAGQDKLARMLAAARMQNARQLLAAKIQILDELFVRVKQRIERMPDEEYLAMMKRLLQKCVQTGREEVIVAKGETRISQAFIDRFNTETQSSLRLGAIRQDIGGGFILSDGKVRINAGIDVLVRQLWDRMEIELAAKLFQ